MKKISYKILQPMLFFIFVFIFSLYVLKTKGVANLDFIWTFGFAHDIRNGYIPYTDFNMILFPLFGAIMAPFAANMTTYCIAGSAIFAGLSTIIFCYIKQLRWLLVILCAVKLLGIEFWEYNTLMIFFTIFSFITLKEYYKTGKSYLLFLTGLFLSLALLTKHNVPAIAIIWLTIFIAILSVFEKKYKDFALYALGGILPAIILLMVSLKYGFLNEMIDITVLGLGDFSTLRNTHFSVAAIHILVIFIEVAILFIQFKTSFKDAFYIFGYVNAGLQIIKMEDLFHVICGIMYFGLLFIIILQEVPFSPKKFLEDLKQKTISWNNIAYISFTYSLICAIMLVGTCSAMNYAYMVSDSNYTLSESNVYGDVKVNTFFNNVISATSEYINNHPNEKVVVISEFAKAISLYENTHWGVMDMNLLYNGGVSGPEKIINEMYKYDKLISLQTGSIASNDDLYKYMEEHFEVCDTITIEDKEYNVYKTK